MLDDKDKSPLRVAYERRNRDLDPQLVWRGKDEKDRTGLVVQAHPLYIQEKVHPKVLIDHLRRQTEAAAAGGKGDDGGGEVADMFADFNGLPSEAAKTEFYQHEANWSNRMVLGDSLQVMASLAEREGLRGKVQCIYVDPPYGIKFNSNFQWSTTSRGSHNDNTRHITREPEQVKAFRDTWRDGIHSYLTYLRDRLTAARDLLTESGSVFVQIGDENVHRVRALMDEIFGDTNFVSSIVFQTTTGQASEVLPRSGDHILWYAKDKDMLKGRPLFFEKNISVLASYTNALSISDGRVTKLTDEERAGAVPIGVDLAVFSAQNLRGQGGGSDENRTVSLYGRSFDCGPEHHWKTPPKPGMERLYKASRIQVNGNNPNYRRFVSDHPVITFTNKWDDTAIAGFSGDKKRYVVETSTKVVARCILMATDPGDLVLDPTCGSGTTAYVAEQWGRRWITIDTSRVALALARARIMGARYPYYLLADSKDGLQKEAEITQTAPPSRPTTDNIRHGFVYERVPHITLKSIANNAEIDVIWDKHQQTLEPLRESLNKALKQSWEEWEIPREADDKWSAKAKELHQQWWHNRIARQQEIDASIAAKAEFEYLYDKPYEDSKKVRVAGPFTVESLSPHRALTVDEHDELTSAPPPSNLRTHARASTNSQLEDTVGIYDLHADARVQAQDFAQIILENLKMAGVQQSRKADKINFTSIEPWAGDGLVCAKGTYTDKNDAEKRAGIFIGPEFGTVSRPDLVSAAREAADAEFDVLIACAFNYDAHSTEFERLGKVPILKARMNADLHMADDLKNTGKGNLFVIFGEPDIDIIDAGDDMVQVKINGVDVFHPNSGEVRSDDADDIACWFIDTDYNEESFFVRHAYFLGANDPYKSLNTSLKAEINQEAWETLHSDTSRPFTKPVSGRIAVKVINHLGDEVMKVYRI